MPYLTLDGWRVGMLCEAREDLGYGVAQGTLGKIVKRWHEDRYETITVDFRLADGTVKTINCEWSDIRHPVKKGKART